MSDTQTWIGQKFCSSDRSNEEYFDNFLRPVFSLISIVFKRSLADTLKKKYTGAESNLAELKKLGAVTLHGVNARTMKLHTDLKMRRFDRVVFNFPHAGFKGKENQPHMIKYATLCGLSLLHVVFRIQLSPMTMENQADEGITF